MRFCVRISCVIRTASRPEQGEGHRSRMPRLVHIKTAAVFLKAASRIDRSILTQGSRCPCRPVANAVIPFTRFPLSFAEITCFGKETTIQRPASVEICSVVMSGIQRPPLGQLSKLGFRNRLDRSNQARQISNGSRVNVMIEHDGRFATERLVYRTPRRRRLNVPISNPKK